MRSIGMDVHRSFAQIAVVEDGLCRDEGRTTACAEIAKKVVDAIVRSDAVATTK